MSSTAHAYSTTANTMPSPDLSMFTKLPIEIQQQILEELMIAEGQFEKAFNVDVLRYGDRLHSAPFPKILSVSKYIFQVAAPVFIKNTTFSIHDPASCQEFEKFLRFVEDDRGFLNVKTLSFNNFFTVRRGSQYRKAAFKLMARCTALRTIELCMWFGTSSMSKSAGIYDPVIGSASAERTADAYELFKLTELSGIKRIILVGTSTSNKDFRRQHRESYRATRLQIMVMLLHNAVKWAYDKFGKETQRCLPHVEITEQYRSVETK